MISYGTAIPFRRMLSTASIKNSLRLYDPTTRLTRFRVPNWIIVTCSYRDDVSTEFQKYATVTSGKLLLDQHGLAFCDRIGAWIQPIPMRGNQVRQDIRGVTREPSESTGSL